jgi:hypothetical protein
VSQKTNFFAIGTVVFAPGTQTKRIGHSLPIIVSGQIKKKGKHLALHHHQIKNRAHHKCILVFF